MPSRAHNKLIERIENLNKAPDDATEYATWIKADAHFALLRENARENELIIYGGDICTFIHTVVVNQENLASIDHDDLLRWSGNPFSSLAGYEAVKGQEGVRIERTTDWGTKTLRGAQQLVFARDFEGLNGNDAIQYEILQEYSHLTGIHWRPEQRAYCRFDENGDFDHVVSVTSKGDIKGVTLVSFKREPLEEFLAASNSILVRMFDFTLLRHGKDSSFSHWPRGPENVCRESADLIYRQKIDPGKAAYARGIQLIRPSRPRSKIFSSMHERWFGRKEGPYVAYIALDLRNDCVTRISTDPDCTTNYFDANENSLPFELSIAFFSPDVLAKYKADQDKYTVTSSMISCRNAWFLRSYAVNEAGQVHAYICDLRNLPYKEQQYWLSFNEEPKAGISQRVIETDFWGEWSSVFDPLHEVLHIVGEWHRSDIAWWNLGDEELLGRVSTPLTSSRHEWAEAFSDLSKLVIEGFQVKAIRARLTEMSIAFEKEEKSLKLIERILIGRCELGEGERLRGLREVDLIRSKAFAHSGGSGAVTLANEALQEHDTYAAHFESVCETVAEELKLIEQAFL